MTEALLQYLWQFQHFNKSNLHTLQGEPVLIIYPGKHNTHQGPDFLDAKVNIGNTTWAGNIELHVVASDWLKHKHSEDKNYSNIILHVVWQSDVEVRGNDGSLMPSLELQNLVPKILLERYAELMQRQAFVPSEPYLPALDEMKWMAWKERLAIERLQRKSSAVLNMLEAAGNHWEEVFWHQLARNFGMKVNAEIFETIAKSISINILAKHKNQIHQLEALLLGQAGLLDVEFTEDYPIFLRKEYLFLKKKYSLKQPPAKPFFLRMRPANFPTVRLAQLAMLVHRSSHLLSTIKDATSLIAVKDLLNVSANDYWHNHYLLDISSNYQPKELGRQMIDNIIINTVVPVLFAYGAYHTDEAIKDKALQWLTELAPEKNAIIKNWLTLHVTCKNALESQALLELKNNYCDLRRCLECAVGNKILKTYIA